MYGWPIIMPGPAITPPGMVPGAPTTVPPETVPPETVPLVPVEDPEVVPDVVVLGVSVF